jgi:hypothetical protein
MRRMTPEERLSLARVLRRVAGRISRSSNRHRNLISAARIFEANATREERSGSTGYRKSPPRRGARGSATPTRRKGLLADRSPKGLL